MRLATHEHLIAAEDLADADAGRLHVAERRDLDLDGHDDVRLAGEGQVVAIDLTEGAGIGSWDIRPVRHALASVMRRRPEAYHQTLREHDAKAAGHPDAPGDALVSIHELVLTKEPGLAARLHYDPYERRSGLVRFLAPDTDATAWANGDAVELGDAVEGVYRLSSLELDRATMVRDAAVGGGGGHGPAGHRAGHQGPRPGRRPRGADPRADRHGREPLRPASSRRSSASNGA